jgi:dienelactone hydrolase
MWYLQDSKAAYDGGVRVLRACLVISTLLVLASGCGGSGAHVSSGALTAVTTPGDGGEFAYDASKPLGYVDHGRVNRRGYPIAVHAVSFTAGSDLLDAYLLLPPGRGPFPGVVYLHARGTSSTDFLVPASWIVARGAAALVLTVPSDTAPQQAATSPVAALRLQERLQARDVIAVRRAFDLLQSLPQVERTRLGFVGWSSGARTGALVAGVEHRPRGYVLMSAGSSPVSLYANQAPARLRATFLRILTLIDPLHLVAHATPGTLLLQDGRHDQVVPHSALVLFARAAPAGTDVRWYDAGHKLNGKAYHDQLAWLAGKLGLTGPRVRGVPAGP